MKRKQLLQIFLVVLCLVLGMVSLAGCGTKQESQNNGAEKKVPEEISKAFEYIKDIELTSKVEDINEKVGVESTNEKVDKDTKYTWKLSDNASLIATAKEEGGIYSLAVEVKEDYLKDDNVDFSKYSEISTVLKAGDTITYDQVKEKLGGAEGNMIEKNSTTTVYEWVNNEGGFLKATFSNSNGRCTLVSGRF